MPYEHAPHILPRDVRVCVLVLQVNCNKFHTIEWFLSAFEINVINEVAYFMAAALTPTPTPNLESSGLRPASETEPKSPEIWPHRRGPHKMKRF